jgi:putative transposase
MTKQKKPQTPQEYMPSAEEVQAELAKVQSMDDFFGKEGVFARLFASTLEQMLEGELTEHLGYEPYEAAGRNSGNNRNGSLPQESAHLDRRDDRAGAARPQRGIRAADHRPLRRQHQRTGREDPGDVCQRHVDPRHRRDAGRAVRCGHLRGDDQHHHREGLAAGRGVAEPAAGAIYPIVYLDAIHIKLRREGKVANTAVYNVLGVDMEGHRDILGHWIGDGAEGANFWLSVLTDLQNRGVEDIFLACVDGLGLQRGHPAPSFPQTQVQRCVIHQIRSSLKYVSWKDRKAFVADLKRSIGPPLERG